MNQNVQTTVNETHPKERSSSEQLDLNDSEQSTLEGNAESHTNQTPIASVGWDFENSIFGLIMTNNLYTSLFSPKSTLMPSTPIFCKHSLA